MRLRNRKGKKALVLVLALALLQVLMVACGGTPSSAGGSSGSASAAGSAASAAKTSSDGFLNVHATTEIASLDPQLATDALSLEAITAYLDGLYSLDSKGNPVPALAKSVKKSADGLTYTFTLRDAKWSNGTPVTANDFVYAWRRLVDPAVASEYSFIASVAAFHNVDAVISGKLPVEELGVKAVDDKTLVVNLDVPVPFFEALLTFPSFFPANKEFVEKAGNQYATSPETLLSDGPFEVTSYEPAATTVELTKNADYWDAASVKLPGVRYKVIKENQQAVLSYQNGDLDVANLSGEQSTTFEGDPQLHDILSGFFYYIAPNLKVKGLNNLNLRLALAHSFDKEAVVKNVLKDGSIPANFAVPKELAVGPDGKDFRETAGSYLETDKAKAKEYFAKAKSELGQDKFEYTMLVDDTENTQNVAQFLQAQIQETLPGVTIRLEVLPKKSRVERMQKGDFELGLTGLGPDYADPLAFLNLFTTGASFNYGFWSNAKYDSLIQSCAKGELAVQPEKRWQTLQDAEKLIFDDAAFFPIYQRGDSVLIKPNVKGIDFHVVGGRVFKNAVKN